MARMMSRREVMARIARGGGATLLSRALPVGAAAAVLGRAREARAAVVLDTANPLANFTKDGGGGVATSPAVLTLTDTSGTDTITLFAPDADASTGNDIDVVTTFQVIRTALWGAETGVRVIRAAVAAAIVQFGVRGIGIAAGLNFPDEAHYRAFVPVD